MPRKHLLPDILCCFCFCESRNGCSNIYIFTIAEFYFFFFARCELSLLMRTTAFQNSCSRFTARTAFRRWLQRQPPCCKVRRSENPENSFSLPSLIALLVSVLCTFNTAYVHLLYICPSAFFSPHSKIVGALRNKCIKCKYLFRPKL